MLFWYYYSQESGLYYLQSRYYDPTTGRFINADGQLNTGTIYGINVFAYCENNPINMSDPSGYRAVEDGPRSAWVMITNDNRIISCDSKTVKISPSKTSLAGIEFIANYESFHANKYDDGYGNPTIGYGHLINENDTFDSITQEEALDLLREELKGFEKSVAKYSLYKPIIWDQNQFDAFVSLAYNSGKYYRIVMDAIIDGDDPYNAFSKIVNSNGKFSLGLYRRRMDEADMFVYGTYKRTYRNLGE